jgi:hypothetical protein
VPLLMRNLQDHAKPAASPAPAPHVDGAAASATVPPAPVVVPPAHLSPPPLSYKMS